MKTRIYSLLVVLLLTVISANAQDKTNISIDITFESPIVVGDDAMITVNLNPSITANVKLSVGTNTYDVAVVNGTGIYIIPNMEEGTYDVQASFTGNDQYLESESIVKQLHVNKVPTDISISIDKTSIYVGETATVSIVLDPSITTVATVFVNSKECIVGIVDGKGSLTLSHLEEGVYTISATYGGDGKFVESTSNIVQLNVDKVETGITVTSESPIVVGDDAIITVNMDPLITANVKLSVGTNTYDVAVVNGTGTHTIQDLKEGSYNVQASYAGDNLYSGSTSTVKNLTVNDPGVSTNPLPGSHAVVTLKMTPTINTFVKLTVGDRSYYVPIINGKGTFLVPQLSEGTYNVLASFAEDDQYLGSVSLTKQLKSVPCLARIFTYNKAFVPYCYFDDDTRAVNDDVQVYVVIGYDLAKGKVYLKAVEGNVIPKGLPVVIGNKNEDDDLPADIFILGGDDSQTTVDGLLKNFVSCDGTQTVQDYLDKIFGEGASASEYIPYLLTGGSFKSVDVKASDVIKKDICLLFIPKWDVLMRKSAGTTNAGIRSIGIGDGNTTGIVAVQTTPDPSLLRRGNGEQWYDLQGRKLSGEPTRKGIYIYKGKKVKR